MIHFWLPNMASVVHVSEVMEILLGDGSGHITCFYEKQLITPYTVNLRSGLGAFQGVHIEVGTWNTALDCALRRYHTHGHPTHSL